MSPLVTERDANGLLPRGEEVHRGLRADQRERADSAGLGNFGWVRQAAEAERQAARGPARGVARGRRRRARGHRVDAADALTADQRAVAPVEYRV